MGECWELIRKVKEEKDEFYLVIDMMNPLINKYTKLLYKDDKDDVRSELILALWEAILKMKYFQNDASCLTYLCNALRNKFYELYRKSRKIHDNQHSQEFEILTKENCSEENEFYNFIVREDIKNILSNFKSIKQQLYLDILFCGLSDTQIAEKYQYSRQYINRVKNELYKYLKKYYFT